MDFNNLFKDDREQWVINNELKNKKELITNQERNSIYKLVINSYDILSNDFDSFKNNQIISKEVKINSLNNMISVFSDKEEYEKCTILQNLLTKL